MERDTQIDTTKYLQYLTEDAVVFVDLERIKFEYERVRARYISRLTQLQLLCFSALSFIPNEINKYIVMKYFDHYGVPDKFMEKESVAQKVLKQIVSEGYCEDFCILHMDMASIKHYLGKLRKFLEEAQRAEVTEGPDGEKLAVVPYSVVPTRNRRYSTASPNVIGFYGELRNCLRAPKGYLLIGGDFPQIDGKAALNLYFKTKEVTRLMAASQDSYLVFKEMVRHVSHLRDKHDLAKALESTDYVDTIDLEERISSFVNSMENFETKAQRDVYKVIALKTTYNSQSSPFYDVNRAVKALHSVMISIGRYAMIRYTATLLHKIGYPIVSVSRFGHKRVIPEKSEFTMLSTLFNAPIQTTSSEIIITFVNTILDYMRGKGYGVEDIRVYVNRHDQPIFMIRESVFYKEARYFRQMSRLCVAGWSPFDIKWEVGPNYGDSNNQYTALLDSYPIDDSQLKPFIQANKDIVEPLTLEVPTMCAFSYRILPNGKVVFLLTRQLGEYPLDEYYFEGYKDSRPIEYALARADMTRNSMDLQTMLDYIAHLIQGLPNDKPVLIFTPHSFPVLKQFTIKEHSVFVYSGNYRLHQINKVIIGSIMADKYPEVATAEDRQFSRYRDYYSKRLTKRGV